MCRLYCNFFCNKLQLAIELDGYTHSFEKVFEKDKRKEQKLNESGITVLRYKDVDVMNNIENTPLNPLFLEGIE